MVDRQRADRIWKGLRAFSVALILLTCVAAGLLLRRFGLDDIVKFTPQNVWLAVAAFLAFYAIKSLAFLFPSLILVVAAGVVFDPLLALVVNTVGLVIELCIPYGLGWIAGRELADRLAPSHSRAGKLYALRPDSDALFSYLLRMVGMPPTDVTSLLLGAGRMAFVPYLVTSVLGMAPWLVITTFLGASVLDPGSVGFIVSCILMVINAGVSLLLYWLLVLRKQRVAMR